MSYWPFYVSKFFFPENRFHPLITKRRTKWKKCRKKNIFAMWVQPTEYLQSQTVQWFMISVPKEDANGTFKISVFFFMSCEMWNMHVKNTDLCVNLAHMKNQMVILRHLVDVTNKSYMLYNSPHCLKKKTILWNHWPTLNENCLTPLPALCWFSQ